MVSGCLVKTALAETSRSFPSRVHLNVLLANSCLSGTHSDGSELSPLALCLYSHGHPCGSRALLCVGHESFPSDPLASNTWVQLCWDAGFLRCASRTSSCSCATSSIESMPPTAESRPSPSSTFLKDPSAQASNVSMHSSSATCSTKESTNPPISKSMLSSQSVLSSISTSGPVSCLQGGDPSPALQSGLLSCAVRSCASGWHSKSPGLARFVAERASPPNDRPFLAVSLPYALGGIALARYHVFPMMCA